MSSKSEKLREGRSRPVLSFGPIGAALLFTQNGALMMLVYLAQASRLSDMELVIAVALVLLLGGAGIFRNAFSRASLLRRREDAYRSARRAADRFEQAAGEPRHNART